MMSPWRETWSDFVVESRQATGSGARLMVGLRYLVSLFRLATASMLTAEPPLRNLARDFTFALRRLRHSAGFSAFAIFTLAIGIGSTTAIYSLVYSVALRVPPIPDVDRVMKLYHSPGLSGASFRSAFSWQDFEDLKAQQTSFSRVSGWSRFSHALIAPDGPRPINGELVDGDYFDLLEVRPALGRLLQPADDDPAAPPVMVLSHQFWRSAFGADPLVVGRSVLVGGHEFQVIGVAAEWFRGVNAPTLMTAAAWVPIRQRHLLAREGYLSFRDPADRDNRWVRALGRLRSDRSAESAATDLAQIGARLDATVPLGASLEPAYRFGAAVKREWSVLPFASVRVDESLHRMVAPAVTGVLVTVALVLLVVCTNLANLLLARGAQRRQEVAVRLALGASRFRLIREHVVEAALLAIAGGGIGVLVARGLVVLLTNEFQFGDGVMATIAVRPEVNLQALFVSIGSTLLALLVFGVVPAWHSTRGHVRDVLVTDTAGSGLPRWRGRQMLISSQVAVSLALVGLTVVSVRQVARVAFEDPGFKRDQLGILSVDASLTGFNEGHSREVLDRTIELAQHTPGIEAVTLMSGLPGGGGRGVAANVANQGTGKPAGPQQWMSMVIGGPSMFDAIGLPILKGRAFDSRDRSTGSPVVVLSSLAADQLFGTGSAIGRSLQLTPQGISGAPEPQTIYATVIGVAGEAGQAINRDDHNRRGVVYIPFAHCYTPTMMLVARAPKNPLIGTNALRSALHQIDNRFTVIRAATGTALAGDGVAVFRTIGTVSGLLGGFALVLSLIGLYGVMSFLVAGRTREVGLRIALGATRSQVWRLVVHDGLKPVYSGLVLGCLLMVLAIANPIYLRVLDSTGLVLALMTPLLLLAAAFIAASIPARRAAKVDPNVALRTN